MVDNKVPPEPILDITVECCECGCSFVFSANEIRYYRKYQLTIPARRCEPCRRRRKAGIIPDSEARYD
jgi:hypothetical protein